VFGLLHGLTATAWKSCENPRGGLGCFHPTYRESRRDDRQSSNRAGWGYFTPAYRSRTGLSAIPHRGSGWIVQVQLTKKGGASCFEYHPRRWGGSFKSSLQRKAARAVLNTTHGRSRETKGAELTNQKMPSGRAVVLASERVIYLPLVFLRASSPSVRCF
jgi:hypothetical protein